MGIMDNEGHDPMGFGNVPRSTDALRAETFERQYRQACQDHAVMRHQRDQARAENERLRAALKLVDDYWTSGIGKGRQPPWKEVRDALAHEQSKDAKA